MGSGLCNTRTGAAYGSPVAHTLSGVGAITPPVALPGDGLSIRLHFFAAIEAMDRPPTYQCI